MGKTAQKSALSASRRALLTGNAEIGGKICSEAPLCARCEKMCWAFLCYLLKVCKKKYLRRRNLSVGHIQAEDHGYIFRNGESNPGLQGENLLS
jgi:hypothetical protein